MKKGFTLVELLAVIIIISITALIAVPSILNVIGSAEKKSFEITCKEIYKSYDQYEITEETWKNDFCTVFEFGKDRNTTEIIDNTKYVPIGELNIKGKVPQKGIYKICSNTKVLIVSNDKYVCTKTEDIMKVEPISPGEDYTILPEIDSIISVSTTNSIRLIVNTNVGNIKNYYYKFDNQETVTNSNEQIYNNLNSNKEYTVFIKIEDNYGLTSNWVETKVSTKSINSPIIILNSEEPAKGYSYYTKKKIQITYNNEDISSPEYYFKSDVRATVDSGIVNGVCGTGINPGSCTDSSVTTIEANTWYRTSNQTPIVTYEDNGTLYALISDGKNDSAISTFTVGNMDATKPIVSISLNDIKTDRVTVVATCSDSESGITKYEYSKDNGATWINKTINNHTFTGLTNKESYQYKIKCTNGSGLTGEASKTVSTLEITNPSINQISQTPTDRSWATSRTIQITYNNTNVTNPEYYFKPGVNATVDSGIVTETCGTGTNPGTCTSTNVTSLDANTWYKTNSTNPKIVYKTDGGVLIALISDGKNTGASTFPISNISTGTPTAPIITGGSDNWSNTSKEIRVSTFSTEKSGIAGYQYYISTSSSSQTGGNWENLSGTSVNISTDGIRYIYFRAIANNGNVSEASNYEITKIDTVVPSTPKLVLKLENENGDIYNSGTWTNKSVYHMVKSTDDNSKIVKYQYSHDGKNWSDEINNPNWSPNYSEDRNYFTYKITWEVNNQFYIRSIDNAGNVSEPSDSFRVQIDKTPPTINSVSVTTNTTAKNKLITVKASDKLSDNVSNGSGIDRYEYYLNGKSLYSGPDAYRYVEQIDTIYTVKLYDKVGNYVEQDIQVDNSGAVCSVSNANASQIYLSLQNCLDADNIFTDVHFWKNIGENTDNKKNKVLYLHGYTLTGSIQNSGTLIVDGKNYETGEEGTITNDTTAITNNGKLTVRNVTIKSTGKILNNSYYAIENGGGTLDINSGNFSSMTHAAVINNNGTVTISSGNFSGFTGYGTYGGTTTITGGEFHGSSWDGVSIWGSDFFTTLIINNGKIYSNVGYGIYVNSKSKLTISGGEILGYNAGIGSFATGTVIDVSNGTIHDDTSLKSPVPAERNYGIYILDGTLNVSGGKIYSDNTYGILAERSTVNVTGGTIHSANSNINNEYDVGIFGMKYKNSNNSDFTDGSKIYLKGGLIYGAKWAVQIDDSSIEYWCGKTTLQCKADKKDDFGHYCMYAKTQGTTC